MGCRAVMWIVDPLSHRSEAGLPRAGLGRRLWNWWSVETRGGIYGNVKAPNGAEAKLNHLGWSLSFVWLRARAWPMSGITELSVVAARRVFDLFYQWILDCRPPTPLGSGHGLPAISKIGGSYQPKGSPKNSMVLAVAGGMRPLAP